MSYIFMVIKFVSRNNLILGLYYRCRSKFLKAVFVENSNLDFQFPITIDNTSLECYFKEEHYKKRVAKISEDFIQGKIQVFQHVVNFQEFKISKHSSFSKELPGKDIRFVWEIYRNKVFFTLGLRYHATKNEVITEAVVNYLSEFESYCPIHNNTSHKIPYCAMEASIRLYNLYWIPYFFSKSENYYLIDDKIKSIFQNYLNYIWKNYEVPFYGLESNHSMSDAFGLILGASILPKHPMSKKWFRFGKKILLRSTKKQFYKDGVNFESSTHYNRFVFEILMISYVIFKEKKVHELQEFTESFRKIGLSLMELSHSNGMISRFGDNDGGKLLHDTETLEEFLSLEYMNWFRGSSKVFSETLIFPEHQDFKTFLDPINNFTIQNYVVMKHQDISLISPTVTIGSNGKGNHQHNDFVSFELYGKSPLIVDPWSYCYSGNSEYRNKDRSTKRHNTICIDNREIVPFDKSRLFEMLGDIKIQKEQIQTQDHISEVMIAHNGYRNLESGKQIHRRTYRFNKDINEIEIIDQLSGAGFHKGEIMFFVPKKYWSLNKKNNLIIFENMNEKFTMTCDVKQIEVHNDFISPNFLSKEDAYLIKGMFNYEKETKIKTKIVYQSNL